MVEDAITNQCLKMFCSMNMNPSVLYGFLIPYVLSQDLQNIHVSVMKIYEYIFTEAQKTEN